MRRGGLGLVLLFVFASASQAVFAEPYGLLKKAEANFARGVTLKGEPDKARKFFAASAKACSELYQQGIRNADLCRNWGNAEFLADHLPQAILAWRLGLLIAPADAELLANLEYARDQVEYPPGNLGRPQPRSWPAWLPFPGLETVLIVAFILYLFTCGMAMGWFIHRETMWVWLTGGCLLVFLGIAGFGARLALDEHEAKTYPLVVISKEHVLHRGNGTSYPAHEKIPTVRPGMEARLLFERGSWLQIELAGGHVGWVPQSAALVGKW
jgi:hypothetical protein